MNAAQSGYVVGVRLRAMKIRKSKGLEPALAFLDDCTPTGEHSAQ
jgi:hypothetical protein